jgi:hypothetical protein
MHQASQGDMIFKTIDSSFLSPLMIVLIHCRHLLPPQLLISPNYFGCSVKNPVVRSFENKNIPLNRDKKKNDPRFVNQSSYSGTYILGGAHM